MNRIITTLLVCAAAASASSAAAQSRGDVHAGVVAGWYDPSEPLGVYYTGVLISGMPFDQRAQLGAGGLVGITADVALGRNAALRLSTGRTAGMQLSQPSSQYGTRNTDPTSDVQLGDTEQLGRAAISSVSIDLLLSVPIRTLLTPYARAGVGIRRYEFDRNDLGGTQPDAAFDDQLQPAWQYGAGVLRSLGRCDVYVEGTRYHSRYRGIRADESGAIVRNTESQRDLAVTAGIRWKL